MTTHVIDTHEKCLIEVFLMSAPNKCLLQKEEKYQFDGEEKSLIWSMHDIKWLEGPKNVWCACA